MPMEPLTDKLVRTLHYQTFPRHPTCSPEALRATLGRMGYPPREVRDALATAIAEGRVVQEPDGGLRLADDEPVPKSPHEL